MTVFGGNARLRRDGPGIVRRGSKLLGVLTLTSVACGDSSADGDGSSAEFGCRDPMDDTYCTQYLLLDEDDVDAAKESCTLGGLQEVIEGCPADDVAGCCVLETAQYTAHQCYYAPSMTSDVQDQCAMLGQDFVDGP